MKKIELGMRVKDTKTLFTGLVTARAEYLYGQPRILVENIDSTGRPVEWWYDEERLEEI